MIPINTTTVTVLRPSRGADIDPYVITDDKLDFEEIENVRATISTPSGTERNVGGSQESVIFRLDCDPCDLQNTDRVKDETTGTIYEVIWAEARNALGMSHVSADLKRVVGASNA